METNPRLNLESRFTGVSIVRRAAHHALPSLRLDTIMEAANSQRSRRGGRRLAVVSGYALRPLTPRGQRTEWLLKSLERDWDVELFALPPVPPSGDSAAGGGRVPWRRAAGDAVRATLLDKWEPWSVRRFGRWQPQVDAALLIAYPWSPVAYAARRLQRAGVPYVVDAGDPWVLTSPVTDTRLLAKSRSRRAERAIWSGAAGAVVTTEQQAAVIAGLFPSLPILVRPNGYEPVPARAGAAVQAAGARDPEHLRLVHYGMLTFLRVDVARLLEGLAGSGRWKSISFTQYGDDYTAMLARAPASVEIEHRPARPWAEVLAGASQYDLAVVVGNRLTGQLPSKAVQYMTLPIPRLALCHRGSEDALAEYVNGRPGWLALVNDDPDAGRRVWEHVDRGWTDAELAPPAEEAWSEVADRIGAFLERCVGGAGAGGDGPARGGDQMLAGRRVT